MDPFKYEIELKQSRAGRPRKNGVLPLLYPWQYGKELYPPDNFYQMLNSYKSWIYVCSLRNSTAVANVPLRLYVAKNNKGQKLKGYPTRKIEKKMEGKIRDDAFLQNIPAVRKASEIVEILDHPYLDLMRTVNPFMNSYDNKELSSLYLELTGNCFWYVLENKLGIPKEIWLIPPTDCKIIPDRQKFISGYKYTKGTEEIDLSERQIIHFKFSNPNSVYYGHAPYLAIADEFGLNKSINDFERSIFDNGGYLGSGVFETDAQLGDFEWERLRTEIKQTFTGTSNAGRLTVLDNGLKYKPLGNSPKDLSYLKGRDVVKEAIVNAYGLVMSLFSKDANRANVEGGIYQYMKFTIAPRLAKFQEKINEKLIWRYDDRLFVAFDDCVPEDKSFELEKRVKHASWGIEPLNEIRKELNKEPYDERFDEPLLPLNTTVMEEILNRVVRGQGDGNIVDKPEKMKQLIEQ